MALWIPIALIAGTVLGVYSQRKTTPTSSCGELEPEERASLDRFLQSDPETILAIGRSQSLDKGQVVNAIHRSALDLAELGCKADADHVHAKADEVARFAEAPASSATSLPQLTGAFVTPEVRIPAAPGETSSGATQHGVAPGTTARLDEAYAHAFSGGGGGPSLAPTPARTPPIALMRAAARIAIRPEPVAWNDEAMGKLGFTVPAGYPIAISAFGPPHCPPGWAKVELSHPDDGVVEGFTEAANLAPPTPPSTPTAAAGARTPATSARPQQPSFATSFQGRSRTRANAQANRRSRAPVRSPTTP